MYASWGQPQPQAVYAQPQTQPLPQTVYAQPQQLQPQTQSLPQAPYMPSTPKWAARQPGREAPVQVVPPPAFSKQPFAQKAQSYLGMQKSLEATLTSTTASTMVPESNVSRRISSASVANSELDNTWHGVSRRVSSGSTYTPAYTAGEVSRLVSEAVSLRSAVLSDPRTTGQSEYHAPTRTALQNPLLPQVAEPQQVVSLVATPLTTESRETEPPFRRTPEQRSDDQNPSKDPPARVRSSSRQSRSEQNPRGEVVWAGAGKERRASNMGTHTRERSEDRATTRAPRKSVSSVDDSAHGSCLPTDVNSSWQASLCAGKIFEDKAPLDQLSKTERPGWDNLSASRSSRSESARPRRASIGAGPESESKPPNARALTTKLFGEVPERPLSTPRQRAREFTDVHGRNRIGYMNENENKQPNSARDATAQCIPRKYMREVVDASGRSTFLMTDGTHKVSRSQSQDAAGVPCQTPRARPARISVARGDIVDALGNRNTFVVEKGVTPTVLGYPACVRASPRIRGRSALR